MYSLKNNSDQEKTIIDVWWSEYYLWMTIGRFWAPDNNNHFLTSFLKFPSASDCWLNDVSCSDESYVKK